MIIDRFYTAYNHIMSCILKNQQYNDITNVRNWISQANNFQIEFETIEDGQIPDKNVLNSMIDWAQALNPTFKFLDEFKLK